MGPEYKHAMYHASHPTDKFLEECVASWDEYQRRWREEGWEHEHVPYPYTREMIDEYMTEYNEATKLHISAEGPPAGKEIQTAGISRIDETPHWASDDNHVKSLEDQLRVDSAAWWKAQSDYIRLPGDTESKTQHI